MKIFAIFLFCGALLLSGCGIFATTPIQTEPPTTPVDPLGKLHANIDAVLEEVLFTTASIGIKVVAVETGEVIYEKNSPQITHTPLPQPNFSRQRPLWQNWDRITSLKQRSMLDADA